MKKVYIAPHIRIEECVLSYSLLADSINVTGNGDIDYGGGSSAPANARAIDWDNWEELFFD